MNNVLDKIYILYLVTPYQGQIYHRLAAKFAVMDGEVFFLADYFNILPRFLSEGPVTELTVDGVQKMKRASRFKLVSKGDLVAGLHPELLQRKDFGGAEDDTAEPIRGDWSSLPSTFDYMRPEFDRPHTVEIKDGRFFLDGSPLGDGEVKRILETVKQGTAKLTHRRSPMEKMEKALKSLMKVEEERLSASMARLRELVDKGLFDEEHFDTLRQEFFRDAMIPEMGNKRAFGDFSSTHPGGGAHVMMDANFFKTLNDELGHEVGDQAIRQMGRSILSAADKTFGGKGQREAQAKVHRFGGDEFHVHLPSHEHAGQFLRHLRGELESLPPFGGTHRLSLSAGIGHTFEHADQALNLGAKGQKEAAVRAIGQDPALRGGQAPHTLYAHSAHPGFEGPVPWTSWIRLNRSNQLYLPLRSLIHRSSLSPTLLASPFVPVER